MTIEKQIDISSSLVQEEFTRDQIAIAHSHIVFMKDDGTYFSPYPLRAFKIPKGKYNIQTLSGFFGSTVGKITISIFNIAGSFVYGNYANTFTPSLSTDQTTKLQLLDNTEVCSCPKIMAYYLDIRTVTLPASTTQKIRYWNPFIALRGLHSKYTYISDARFNFLRIQPIALTVSHGVLPASVDVSVSGYFGVGLGRSLPFVTQTSILRRTDIFGVLTLETSWANGQTADQSISFELIVQGYF